MLSFVDKKYPQIRVINLAHGSTGGLLCFLTPCISYDFIVDAIEFNEANVRNAIANVTNIRELGERLKIPSSKLDDIDKLSLENRKQKFVEVWFRVETECNWNTLVTAIRAIMVSEWKTSKSLSETESSLLSPKSNSSRTNSFGEAMAGIMQHGLLKQLIFCH